MFATNISKMHTCGITVNKFVVHQLKYFMFICYFTTVNRWYITKNIYLLNLCDYMSDL